jgi:hypothetical protein
MAMASVKIGRSRATEVRVRVEQGKRMFICNSQQPASPLRPPGNRPEFAAKTPGIGK